MEIVLVLMLCMIGFLPALSDIFSVMTKRFSRDKSFDHLFSDDRS